MEPGTGAAAQGVSPQGCRPPATSAPLPPGLAVPHPSRHGPSPSLQASPAAICPASLQGQLPCSGGSGGTLAPPTYSVYRWGLGSCCLALPTAQAPTPEAQRESQRRALHGSCWSEEPEWACDQGAGLLEEKHPQGSQDRNPERHPWSCLEQGTAPEAQFPWET